MAFNRECLFTTYQYMIYTIVVLYNYQQCPTHIEDGLAAGFDLFSIVSKAADKSSRIKPATFPISNVDQISLWTLRRAVSV